MARPEEAFARAMEIFRRVVAIARRRPAPAAGDGGDRGREPGLPRHLRDRVRLFAMDFELGGLPVPDPARGAGSARGASGAANPDRRSQDPDRGLDRDTAPARRRRAAVLRRYRLGVVFSAPAPVGSFSQMEWDAA